MGTPREVASAGEVTATVYRPGQRPDIGEVTLVLYAPNQVELKIEAEFSEGELWRLYHRIGQVLRSEGVEGE